MRGFSGSKHGKQRTWNMLKKYLKRLAIVGALALFGGAVVFWQPAFAQESDSPVAAETCPDISTGLGTVNYEVVIPQGATYAVWAHARSLSADPASFFIEVDEDYCGITYTTQPNNGVEWAWSNNEEVSDGTTQPIQLELSEGSHTLRLIGRYPLVEVDQILFTSDTACQPSGDGSDCINEPEPSAIATPVLEDDATPVPSPQADQPVTLPDSEVGTDSNEEPVGEAPERPQTPAVNDVREASVTLQWPGVEGVERYRIYRNGQVVAVIDRTEFRDAGLRQSSVYTYEVAALSEGGVESKHSPSLTVATEGSSSGRQAVTGCDLDGDDRVNERDLSILKQAWGSDDPAADLNGDGTVDGVDLSIVMSCWRR